MRDPGAEKLSGDESRLQFFVQQVRCRIALAAISNQMSFVTYFRASSYITVAVAMLALVLAGGLNPLLAVAFGVVMVAAWRLENTRWQLSERAGLILVLTSLPLLYLDWKYLSPYLDARFIHTALSVDRPGVLTLGHLIVFLSTIKLLQVKADRDWVFLYLISFFELLLAAGLSFGPVFLISLSVYLTCVLSTIIAFEIHKASRRLQGVETRLLVPPDSKMFTRARRGGARLEVRRLPLIAFVLLLLVFVLGLPLFLVTPRPTSALIRGPGGGANFIGFSESVGLGEIGTLKQNNQVVMHVRIEEGARPQSGLLRWRGVALDEYTGRGWKKSADSRRAKQESSDRGFFQLGTTESLPRLTTQTFFVEPLDTPVLFAAPRVVAVQGAFPYLRVDAETSMQSRRHEFDRIIYKALSDTTEPDPDVLRKDLKPYPPAFQRYLQKPDKIDPRIDDFALAILRTEHATNRYDAARAIESKLQSYYRYSLEMKASGPDPLSDFLFNVGQGHCEYFATAMAVLLRTRGVATRVVNGFLPGEYNDAANAYTVRESDAHSWVEVYFPETNTWVTFDPTPPAGREEPTHAGFAGWFGKYAEAFELMWFQYIVGYDKQEQRQLATGLSSKLFELRKAVIALIALLQTESAVKGLYLILAIALLLPAVQLIRRVRKHGWRLAFRFGSQDTAPHSVIEFYERMIRLLKARGIERPPHQTPLEFALATGLRPALTITQMYNQARFSGKALRAEELATIEASLRDLIPE